MHGDTGFTYVSEISRWWNGFINGSDLLRIYISLFYQVSYLLGELTGNGGSWVPYQIVYAVLWWTRGLLLFVIGRRLLPGHDLFWYITGAFVLVHSSDESVGWVGQMHQSAYILWMLLAFWALIDAFQGKRVYLSLGVCALFEHLSLWTYESQLLLIAIAPLLLQGLFRLPTRKWIAITAAWLVVPAIYVITAAAKYAHSGGATYQQSVLRKDWGIGSLISDWIFNMNASLSFWNWSGSEQAKADHAALFASFAVVIFLAGFLVMMWIGKFGAARPGWRVATLGIVLFVLSFPIYLVLDSARSLWRTQILSGIGAALLFGALIMLARKSAVIAVLAAMLVAFGSYSALKKAAYQRWVWERYRAVIAAVIHAAPRVKSETFVVLTGVPKNGAGDPLNRSELWFDIATRLAHPGTPVRGMYFYADGTAPSDAVMPDVDAGTLLLLEYHPDGKATIAQRLPVFLTSHGAYQPEGRIEPGAASERSMRRYGP